MSIEGKRIVSKTTRRDILKGGAAAGLAGMMNAVPGIAEAQSAQSAQTPELKWKAPGKQTGNNFNLIVLVSDTFRADNLAAYGSQWVETPYLNQLAEQSVVFESFYPEGMPTVPIRRQLYTGRRIFPTHTYFQHSTAQSYGWHPLYIEDVTLADAARGRLSHRPDR
jgi:hypothetical protein